MCLLKRIFFTSPNGKITYELLQVGNIRHGMKTNKTLQNIFYKIDPAKSVVAVGQAGC